MQMILPSPPPDWFDDLAVKILDTLLFWRKSSSSIFIAPGRGQWIFDFDGYRNDGRSAAVEELLVAFSGKSKQVAIQTLTTLAGVLVMSSERYDFSMKRAVDQDPTIKIRYIAGILRREFGG